MPAVLVHGNPETPAVWDAVLPLLGRDDVIRPQLPGFGIPAPEGWGATKEEYVAWLAGVLEEIGVPVDLVGHDWGGGFVLRLACTRPDLIRSWVSDVAGLFDPDYVWHDFAQIWQTPGAGEEWAETTLATPVADRAALLESVGVSGPQAIAFAEAMDAEMARCILALYRSAAQPAMREWGADAEAARARPGLVVAPGADPFTGGHPSAAAQAARMGARVGELPGLGHWWMLQDPEAGATVLREFWASLDG